MDEISPLTLICVGSSFLFSRLFHQLYQQKRLEIQKIKEIPKYQPNEDLLRILKASPQKRLSYAAVEGLVQPDGDPLASQYVPRCFGVVQKVHVQEKWEVWNPTTKTWYPRNMNKKETNNLVPFHLGCPGAFASKVAVKVHAPLEAVGPYLEQVYHRVRYAREGLMHFMMHELASERPVSLEETEEILRVGTTLTGFGEVVLEHGHVIRLQPPMDGRQYVLFPTNYQGYLQMHQSSATMWKVLTAVFGLAGATLLVWTLYRAYQRHQSKRGRN
ncbi:hypothetical protein SKAU_G00197670 [Synaphobranchus kaupii]|uniref:RING-type E3 ubiquitin transferase n=1 Tax=Synaphobranchus kaupii TaxID=118154 RepID=A0A9Q1FES7_SYNKA|nr:hypothetical protein SKAU_G00197670 [Synaphobranchus kaupii]